MKDAVILAIAVLLLSIGLFMGVRLAVQKTFQSTPKTENSEHSRKIDQQSDRAQDTYERQRQLMRDQQQRMKDAQRMRMR